MPPDPLFSWVVNFTWDSTMFYYMKLGSYWYLVIILCELLYLLPAPVPGHQSDETSPTGTQCSMYFVQIPSVSASSLLQHVPWFLSVLKRCIPNESVLVKYDMGNHYKLCYWILGKWPTWFTIALYKTFIIIILYMFRATLCLSSGGRIVLIQHLV